MTLRTALSPERSVDRERKPRRGRVGRRRCGGDDGGVSPEGKRREIGSWSGDRWMETVTTERRRSEVFFCSVFRESREEVIVDGETAAAPALVRSMKRESESLERWKGLPFLANKNCLTMVKILALHLTMTIGGKFEKFVLFICSVSRKVAFGIRFDEEAHEKRRFDEILAVTQEMLAGFFFSDYFPLFGWLDKLFGNISRLEKNFMDLDEFYEELIEKHLNPNRPKSMEGDIIDLLLQLRKEQLTPIDLTLDNIKAILMNVFVAGTDTSAATVVWAMTALIKNSKAMNKVQEEIRKSIGNKRIVNEDDVQICLISKQ
ncbi:putative cytochrome 83B1-like [Capsicum annuum]|nr:putative cytochrome 83B1-like [Capsicum annuum]